MMIRGTWIDSHREKKIHRWEVVDGKEIRCSICLEWVLMDETHLADPCPGWPTSAA